MGNKRTKKVFADVFIYLILAFMYVPILLIIIFSFSGQSSFNFNKGFSLDSYLAVFQSEKLRDALVNTLVIAAISSVAATIMGTFAAIGIFHLKKWPKKVVNSFNQLPMINAEIVMAVSLMLFFTAIHLPDGYLKLIIAHISFCTPYVVVNVIPRIMQLDPNIYEAALDLGATPARALMTIQIPLLTPGIISGFVMAFTLSIDDFIITEFNKGSVGIETLSTVLYKDARVKGLEPYWFPVFSVIFIIILTSLLAINLINAKKGRNLMQNRNR